MSSSPPTSSGTPGRWIVISGIQPESGGRQISLQLAQELASRRRVLFWDVASCCVPEGKTFSQLLPYLEALSPAMLLNYLRREEEDLCTLRGGLGGDRSPSVGAFDLMKRAFDYIVVLAPPAWDQDYLELLGSAHLLLLISRADGREAAEIAAHVAQLTRHRFPKALGQIVFHDASPESNLDAEAFKAIVGGPWLAAVPALSFKESIRRLADLLETRNDVYCADLAVSADDAQKAKSRIHGRLLDATTSDSEQKVPRETTQAVLENLLAEEADLPQSREVRQRVLTDLLHDVLGLGPLEPLLQDPEVAEIMVNGPEAIYVEKKGRVAPTDVRFQDEKQLRTVIDRIVAPIGRRVDESAPLCDARLADGSRVNIVLPPLALDGPTLTIRRFMEKRLGLEDLIGFGTLSRDMGEFLAQCVRARKNILVSGGTGSGKTTLLNILSGFISPEERIVTIEDAAELKLQQPHVVRLESRPPNAEGQGAISIRRLVINALRMRPDRIVVGECRGGEALDMLQAMNTGHDGSLTTLHANTPRDGLGRLEALVLMAGLDLPIRVVREQIRSAVHFVIQIARLSDGSRKITSITELTGMEADVLTTAELFRYRAGHFEATGLVSAFLPPLKKEQRG